MVHPADEHAPLHVFAEVEQPREQLVLGDRAPRQHDAVRPAHFIVQSEGLDALESLAGERGVHVRSRLASALCVVGNGKKKTKRKTETKIIFSNKVEMILLNGPMNQSNRDAQQQHLSSTRLNFKNLS